MMQPSRYKRVTVVTKHVKTCNTWRDSNINKRKNTDEDRSRDYWRNRRGLKRRRNNSDTWLRRRNNSDNWQRKNNRDWWRRYYRPAECVLTFLKCCDTNWHFLLTFMLLGFSGLFYLTGIWEWKTLRWTLLNSVNFTLKYTVFTLSRRFIY